MAKGIAVDQADPCGLHINHEGMKMKSRQVERAELRREFKAMDARAKARARNERQVAVEKRETPVSTLRLAAMRAVSRLQPKRVEKRKSASVK